ncbi:immunity protein Imm33 domain-containing protein, partial [Pseudomonas syringae]|uniref:immunity protein Imm33 domain-containing protein n=2 Tax=Pseudomonas syringae group TaxID=136849 RepID=UPI003F6853CF
EVHFFDFCVGSHHEVLAPEKNWEHSIKLQLPAWNVGFMRRLRYNGDTQTLKTVHAYHVAEHRPDLVKFLALPFGYRFHEASGDVWKDKNQEDYEALLPWNCSPEMPR